MPTVMRIGAYRLFFYSNENDEPRHIHVRSAEKEAKFWLEPIKRAWNSGFNERELNQIEEYIEENLAKLIESWDMFFGALDAGDE